MGDLLQPSHLFFLVAFVLPIAIVGIVFWYKAHDREVMVHRELQMQQMEHERKMKEMEIEKTKLELEKSKTAR